MKESNTNPREPEVKPVPKDLTTILRNSDERIRVIFERRRDPVHAMQRLEDTDKAIA
jgi:hypothetical protein